MQENYDYILLTRIIGSMAYTSNTILASKSNFLIFNFIRYLNLLIKLDQEVSILIFKVYTIKIV